ncbi:SRPBCC family protein [Shewanella waksmanii]|uniref:SRPBCC family protein n=1 Tax=Shewanella waksmanii TaxID=213783 RepID=UPI00048A816E|nr:SRPBCC family protein [Shewanella waksmanii]
MLKKVLIIFAVLIALPFVLALFAPKNYSVVTSVDIGRDNQTVYDYVVLLKNQDNFSVWAQVDPQMQKSYRGEDGQVGFVSAWKSDNPDVGEGEQEITAIVPGQRIDYELRFLAPFEAVSPAYMIVTPIDADNTQVTWGFTGHLDYPMNLMMWFIDFETMIDNDLSQGLNSLKSLLEAQ